MSTSSSLATTSKKLEWNPPFNRPVVTPKLVSIHTIGAQNYGLFIAQFVWPLGSTGQANCDHREVKIKIPCILRETHGYVDSGRAGVFEYTQIDSVLGEVLTIPGHVTLGMFDGMHEALLKRNLLLDPEAVIRAASKIYFATRTPITQGAPQEFQFQALIAGI